MNRSRRVTTAWVIAIGCSALVGLAEPLVLSSSVAQAQSAGELFNGAQELFDKGDYDGALVLFRRAYDASKSPNAHLMIGHCLVALGKTVEAYEAMSATMKEAAVRAQDEAKYAPTRDSAATQLALLEPKIGKVIVLVADEQQSQVTIDGTPLSSDRLGTPVAVQPGTLTIKATRPDGTSTEQEVKVGAGETQKISLQFKAKAPPAPSAVSRDRPVPASGGAVRKAGFAVAGVGVAGMALFGVAGAMVQSKLKTLEDECSGARCTDMKYADVIDSGKTMALLANIGLGVGIAGIVGGGSMIIFGGPSQKPPNSATFELSPQGAMVRYAGVF